MNPIDKLELSRSSLTKSEAKITNYIINNPMDIIQLPIVDIAHKSGGSKSAIIRLCQKIGYNGFSEFKFDLSRYMISNNQSTNDFEEKDSITAITSSYVDYINKIATTITYKDVQTLVNFMLDSKKIKIFGINRTGLSANQLRYRLSKIAFDSESITDIVLMKDCSDSLNENDLCIIFSIKAHKEYYLDSIKALRENNCKVVLITMTPINPLNSYCDYVITLPYISKLTDVKFLDDQVIFFVFIEIILSELAKLIK